LPRNFNNVRAGWLSLVSHGVGFVLLYGSWSGTSILWKM